MIAGKFIALAGELKTQWVTMDNKLLRAFPKLAIRPAEQGLPLRNF